MNQILQGIIHGRIIELDSDPGINSGQKVQVILRLPKMPPPPPPGWKPGCTETAAGMLAESWTEEDDRVVREIKLGRNPRSCCTAK